MTHAEQPRTDVENKGRPRLRAIALKLAYKGVQPPQQNLPERLEYIFRLLNQIALRVATQ